MNMQNGKNRSAIFTILRHLGRAKHAPNGDIELMLSQRKALY